MPQVVDAVKIPVMAAGGIGDGRGLLAAFALGALGIQMGTRFMATAESDLNDWGRQRLLAMRDSIVQLSAPTNPPIDSAINTQPR